MTMDELNMDGWDIAVWNELGIVGVPNSRTGAAACIMFKADWLGSGVVAILCTGAAATSLPAIIVYSSLKLAYERTHLAVSKERRRSRFSEVSNVVRNATRATGWGCLAALAAAAKEWWFRELLIVIIS